MPYTPVELRHVKLGRSLRGYRRDETERVLEEVANSFEEVWRDRGELTDKVEELEQRLDEHKQREHLLTQTLVAAERAAAEAREQARREAELIVSEAHQEARSIMRGAQSERERLVMEARRVEILLRSALGLIEQGSGDAASANGVAWPDRSDTREFQAVVDVPDVPEEPAPAEPEAAPVEEPERSRDFNWG